LSLFDIRINVRRGRIRRLTQEGSLQHFSGSMEIAEV
jgi:hypothetical protein